MDFLSFYFFFSSRRRHTRLQGDWSSDVCSSDLQTFKIAKVGTIAGCFVRSGVIPRTARVRVIRDGVEVYEGGIGSLKRFKDDVREVREGFECGIGIENFNDVKVGDLIEAYRIEEVARSLDVGSAAKGG